MTTNLTELPFDLPRPLDDGGADHLVSLPVPIMDLPSTSGKLVSTSQFKKGLHILFCYPMTGKPGVDLPSSWNIIPGARGCTPECLKFAIQYGELSKLGFSLFGVSTQGQEYQKEMTARLGLPFEVLSDEKMLLTRALRLSTMEVEGRIFLKRLTLVIKDGVIIKMFYPVFPPDKHPEEVAYWAKCFVNRQK
ncbi:MAG: peroxiredoxin [Patescibacteria group bacterium]|nr:peroxiredoxin [Patescibacteria group bacterium]